GNEFDAKEAERIERLEGFIDLQTTDKLNEQLRNPDSGLLRNQRESLGIDALSKEKLFEIKVIGNPAMEDKDLFEKDRWWEEMTDSPAMFVVRSGGRTPTIYLSKDRAESILAHADDPTYQSFNRDALMHEYRHTQRDFASKNERLFRLFDEAATNVNAYKHQAGLINIMGMTTQGSFDYAALKSAYESDSDEKKAAFLGAVSQSFGSKGLMLFGSRKSSESMADSSLEGDGIEPVNQLSGAEFAEALLEYRSERDPRWLDAFKENIRKPEMTQASLETARQYDLAPFIGSEVKKDSKMQQLVEAIDEEIKRRGTSEGSKKVEVVQAIPEPKIAEQPESGVRNDLREALREMGVEAKDISLSDNTVFSEAIILSRKEAPAGKTVRVFRGVNHLDSSIFNQTSYAMRAENVAGKAATIEDVKTEVENLANRPTYENLIAYVDKVSGRLSDAERRRLNDDLRRIEDGVLDGWSVRQELSSRQIEHGGGIAERGISPYVSATYNAAEAAGYIRGEGAVLVIDVPISEIEENVADSKETNIKGQVNPKYITAVLTKKWARDTDPKKLNEDVERALATVAEAVPGTTETETQTLREQKFTEEERQDVEQRKIDIELVRRKRAEALTQKFREVNVEMPSSDTSSAESAPDIYTKTKTAIFDYYADRIKKIGRGGRSVEDYDFADSIVGSRKPFDREHTTDIMLVKLKELVKNLEDREAERARNR
ncbi:MAG: hypothetical protein KGJ13_10645, partial [Patescibacteria group bacterium]|nr:hypothetical protein [Patescibacteria group bacterium]